MGNGTGLRGAVLLELRQHHRLVTVWADRVTEIRARALVDGTLDLLPVVFVVAGLLAVRTDREKGLEVLGLGGEAEGALGHAEPHPPFIQVERLRQKFVHARIRRLALVVMVRRTARQRHDINRVRAGSRPDPATPLEAVHLGHDPIAHDHAHRLPHKHLARLFTVTRQDHLVVKLLQRLVQDPARNRIIFNGEDFQGVSPFFSNSSAVARRPCSISRPGPPPRSPHCGSAAPPQGGSWPCAHRFPGETSWSSRFPN